MSANNVHWSKIEMYNAPFPFYIFTFVIWIHFSMIWMHDPYKDKQDKHSLIRRRCVFIQTLQDCL